MLAVITIWKEKGELVTNVLNSQTLFQRLYFSQYPIIGVKRLDFEAWCKIAKLIEAKKHLTAEGLVFFFFKKKIAQAHRWN